MVRDLWALRLDSFSGKVGDISESEGDEPEYFSSQPSGQSEAEDETYLLQRSRTQWPRLIDSVGLCYLGALLLRLPATIAEMHRCSSLCEYKLVAEVLSNLIML